MMRSLGVVLVLALAVGCSKDGDGDGIPSSIDCDDDNAAVSPAADELCNGIDDDCDGQVDENPIDASIFYADVDGDGFGDAAGWLEACAIEVGYVEDASDCDDDDATVNPDATDACDGIDNNCDGIIDENDDAGTSFWADADGDGFGDPGAEIVACGEPEGYVDNDLDCDDDDATISPAQVELCDNTDNDCDGDIDEAGAADETTWYADTDADNYGSATAPLDACWQPDGYVGDDSDCNDADEDVFPGATEVCNDVDDDCDGDADENAADADTWYGDGDDDGYGTSAVTVDACEQPDGFVGNDDDCNDGDADISPDGEETCNGFDDDCDGTVDDSPSDQTTWYADSDGDGWGDSSTTSLACDQPSGYVANDDDCDDDSSTIHPGAVEICDGEDQDCDGTDDNDAVDTTTFYADNDGDGFGDPSTTSDACEAPSGYVADANDCDDSDEDVNPHAEEVCNGADDDCDGEDDESPSDGTAYYADSDGDGYGDPDDSEIACSTPSGYVADATDCNDGDEDVFPGADEYCDSTDWDCDGDATLGAVDADTFYADGDSDGYGAASVSIEACTAPGGFVSDNTDCDDGDDLVYPGATELCDDQQNDCDDTGWTDDDGIVTFFSTSGVPSDQTSSWTSGSYGAPAAVSYSSAGELQVCDGTYYVTAYITASSLDVIGRGSGSTIISGGDLASASGAVVNAPLHFVRSSGDFYVYGITATASGGCWGGISGQRSSTCYASGLGWSHPACTVEVEASVASHNDSPYAYGPYGGGIGFYNSTVDLVDTASYGNTDLAGFWIRAGGTTTCTGSIDTDAGAWANPIGVRFFSGGTFESDVCDFDGISDNTTYDVQASGGNCSTWADDESFTCTNSGGCSTCP